VTLRPPPVLAIALDFSDLDEALAMARTVHPWCEIAKVGLQLFTSAGPAAVGALLDEGYEVFLDLKLHDIPNTVGRAAAAAGQAGASLVTAHGAGGEQMLAAAVAGFAETRPGGGVGRGILAVTVLTSEPDPPPGAVAERSHLALETGCAGVVCAGADVAVARSVSEDLVVLVPGVRGADDPRHDQARVATAGAAARAGASVLVAGRIVTQSPDPARAAAALAAEVARAAQHPWTGVEQ
jgi:orotidine-5'-phosphate decarboxylase